MECTSTYRWIPSIEILQLGPYFTGTWRCLNGWKDLFNLNEMTTHNCWMSLCIFSHPNLQVHLWNHPPGLEAFHKWSLENDVPTSSWCLEWSPNNPWKWAIPTKEFPIIMICVWQLIILANVKTHVCTKLLQKATNQPLLEPLKSTSNKQCLHSCPTSSSTYECSLFALQKSLLLPSPLVASCNW